MPQNFDLHLKRAARHMLRCIYQNAIRKDYFEFPNNAKPAQKFLCENLQFFMKFHGYIFLKILTPMVRRLLPCTNEEYMVIAICLEKMLIYQGLILVLKKINNLFS